jgi:hypothetical protein
MKLRIEGQHPDVLFELEHNPPPDFRTIAEAHDWVERNMPVGLYYEVLNSRGNRIYPRTEKTRNTLVDKKKLLDLYAYALSYQWQNAGGIAGQGFTNYTCLKCDKIFSFPNTNVPIFCRVCEDDLKLEIKKARNVR